MIPGLQEAKIAGREAGRALFSAALNPYQLGTVQAHAWEAERLKCVSERLFKTNALLQTVVCQRCEWTGLRCQLVAYVRCPDCGLDQ